MKDKKHIKYIKTQIKSGSNIAKEAEKLKISRQFLHKMLKDNLDASKRLSIRIEKYSDRKISALEAMGLDYNKIFNQN